MESPKILILEDEGPIRGMLAQKFSLIGFTVFEAGTGEEALLIAQKEKPDVITTDIVMYPMDGTTFIKRLRESGPWGARVPCYVLSNQRDPELITQLRTIGATDYINKAETPIDAVAEKIKGSLKK
ncbi:MAG TPA: response regulator [Candidatus Paceibacterota bacterium]|nr:response regulator [Candidatus Paceibacterota bacterium]